MDTKPDDAQKTAALNQRILRCINVNIQRQAEGGWFIRLPGFRYDDFSRVGMPSIVQIDRLLNTIFPGWSLTNPSEADNILFFMVCRQWTFSERLYDRAAIDFPMTLRWAVTAVGNSSFDHRVVLHEGDSATGSGAETLVTSTLRYVAVNPATRRPMKLRSGQVVEARAKLAADGETSTVVKPPVIVPDRCFTRPMRVRFADTDTQLHAHASSYLGFALECAAQAAEFGFYSAISGDVAFYRAKSAKMVYMGESRAEDELTVSTWEDDDNKMLLNFAVRKLGKIVNYSNIEFYDNETSTMSLR